MKYPKLVRSPRTPCKVTIMGEGITKDGAPLVYAAIITLCNYQGSAKKVRTDERELVEVTGTCLFDGDLCPSIPEIASGTVEIFGELRRIVAGAKARNDDGTVNYTRLEIA